MFLNKAMIFAKKQPILSILTLIFAWLAVAYLAKGFYTLAFDSSPSGARDLLERWQEQQYIYLGIYPYRMNPADINAELGSWPHHWYMYNLQYVHTHVMEHNKKY